MDCVLTAFIDWAQRWQTLIGSILGGLFALATALVVARSVRHQDEEAAGYIVTGALAPIGVVVDTLKALSKKEQVTEAGFPSWYAQKIAFSHPAMPTMFDSSVARLVSVDISLAAHLNLFQQAYGQVETALRRLNEDYSYVHEHGSLPRPEDLFMADCRIATKQLQFAAEHAACAIFLISELVLSKLAVWHRFRHHIWLNTGEKECKKLLVTGEASEPPSFPNPFTR